MAKGPPAGRTKSSVVGKALSLTSTKAPAARAPNWDSGETLVSPPHCPQSYPGTHTQVDCSLKQ